MQVIHVSLDQNNLVGKEWSIILELCKYPRKCSYILGSIEIEKVGRCFMCAHGEPNSKLAKISGLAFSGHKFLSYCTVSISIANVGLVSKLWLQFKTLSLQSASNGWADSREPKPSNACLEFGDICSQFDMIQVIEHCFYFLVWTSKHE